MSTIQLRGHCQACGALQAATKGPLAHHGYTVDHGWFNGACAGGRHLPLERDRTMTDEIIASIESEIPRLRAQSLKVAAGEADPPKIVRKHYVGNGRYENHDVLWESLGEYARREWRRITAVKLERRADAGEAHVAMLRKLIDEVHGKPLVEVPLASDKPAPILIGEKRISENGYELIASRVEARRVYFTFPPGADGKRRTGWHGTNGWRKLALA